jgi:hypothetical protein
LGIKSHENGPQKPSLLALRGIRLLDGPEGANPASDPAPDPAPQPTPDPDPDAPKGDDPKPETDWKAEARKWEQRAKENAALKAKAEKWDELEESQKTEIQKATDRAAAAEAKATEQAAKLARLEVAQEHGITKDEAKLLTGTTPEQLAEQAAAILAIRGDKKPPVPQPDPSVGPKAPAKPSGGLTGAISAHYESA